MCYSEETYFTTVYTIECGMYSFITPATKRVSSQPGENQLLHQLPYLCR